MADPRDLAISLSDAVLALAAVDAEIAELQNGAIVTRVKSGAKETDVSLSDETLASVRADMVNGHAKARASALATARSILDALGKALV